MSRYNPHHIDEKWLDFADKWRKECLLGDGSLFTDEQLWTVENCQLLQSYYIDRINCNIPYSPAEVFITKLESLLGGEECLGDKYDSKKHYPKIGRAPKALYKLASEVLCILYLAADDIGRSRIANPRRIWKWSGDPLPASMENDNYLPMGIGKFCAGNATAWLLPEAAIYMIQFILFWKTGGGCDARAHLLQDADEDNALQFDRVLNEWESRIWNSDDNEQCKELRRADIMRKALRYMLFPGFFDRNFVGEYESSTANATGGDSIMQPPLNQILYGPPGTGKTYNTAKRAVEIIDGNTPESDDEIKARYRELLAEGRIVFITFHQSYGYEEFIEGIRPDVDGGDVRYEIKDGLFKELCACATTPSADGFDEAYDKLLGEIDRRDGGIPRQTKTGRPYSVVRGNKFDSIGFSAKHFVHYSYNLTKRTLRKSYETGVPASGHESYTPGLLAFMKQECGLQDLRGDNSGKPYVLIIDEINRGNISKIFGELITLIEVDKREGGKDELSVNLPYSGDKFSVPANVHIIGTMNTADRSIALLDTALRRRFRFIEMMPDSELLQEAAGVDLPVLLDKMNERIKKLHNRDHCIGHSYLMGVDGMDALAEAFEYSIIPLLREYFFDDMKSIADVLNGAFCEGEELLEGDALGEALKQREQYQKIYGDDNG